jgi:YidC/Oxa1 family membrane protein insertase
MSENWRIFAALGLTMIVLVGWNLLFPTQPPQQQGQNQTAPARVQEDQKAVSVPEQPARGTAEPQEDAAETLSASAFQAQSGKSLTVETPVYKAVFNSNGGVVEHFWLKKYRQSIADDAKPIDLVSSESVSKAPMGLLWNSDPTWKQASWSVQGRDMTLSQGQQGKLVFQGDLNGLMLERVLSFTGGSYVVEEELRLINQSDNLASGSLAFSVASPKLVANESRYNRTNVIHYGPSGLKKENDTDDLAVGIQSENSVSWAGIDSNYFLVAVTPISDTMFFKGKFDKGIYRVAMESNTSVQPGQTRSMSAAYYFGPKESSALSGAPNNLKAALHYGWLDIIAKPLVYALQFFYQFVGNYGVAIILLTIVIKLIFWPLSHKSYKSMERMKKIQPMMKKLKEQYKDDRQKMNQELMRLYKTYKVNPAGGCLPMLLQIPVFIGLYEALLGAVELRHASFIPEVPFTDIVWLADLSAKDPLYVTPVVMGLSMFLQQKLSPTAGDPTQAKIMLIMPIFLTFIFLNFPAGLVVYFFTNNVLSIAQQWWTLRNA